MVQQVIKTSMALLIVLAVAHATSAADIRAGAIMQVKPNSIWFDEAIDLAQWQALKKKGDETALAAYEKSKLSSRDAWQFINPLTVKVLIYQQRDQSGRSGNEDQGQVRSIAHVSRRRCSRALARRTAFAKALHFPHSA